MVLIVEDNEDDRDLYGGLLWYNGFDVVHCPDGDSAIENAMDLRPDLVLLDIRLAGTLSGLDVARALREQGFRAPIIVLSALSRVEAGEAAKEAGASVFLEKPMVPVAVVKEVIRHIGHATSNRRGR